MRDMPIQFFLGLLTYHWIWMILAPATVIGMTRLFISYYLGTGNRYIVENSYAEASTLVAFHLLNLMTETGKPISELVAGLHRYVHSGEINSEVEDKDVVLNKLREQYKDGMQNELDGLKVNYPEWWFNVRPSNTEPVLRLTMEASTRDLMEEKRDELLNIIRG